MPSFQCPTTSPYIDVCIKEIFICKMASGYYACESMLDPIVWGVSRVGASVLARYYNVPSSTYPFTITFKARKYGLQHYYTKTAIVRPGTTDQFGRLFSYIFEFSSSDELLRLAGFNYGEGGVLDYCFEISWG